MSLDNVQKGKGNASRKAYKHLSSTNLFGVADRIKAEKKNPKNIRYKRRRRK